MLCSRSLTDKDYQTQFMQAFGRGVNEQDMLRAIATYEQTLVSLFNTKARCNLCHALTD
jgi:cytochrome c peroxidase